ncbi:MAG: hypothetical protein HZB19_02005 [Chloroflexi bacterium]|nr:hypothetical protein [Chloroflexota bacterium]
MTQRSILAGTNPNVIIKAGGSVTVKGHKSDTVTAETKGMWGLKVEKRSEAEIARARAAIGEHVLFDVRLKKPNREGNDQPDDVLEVQIGGSGEVLVPFGSNVKVYAGKDIDARNIKGQVDAYAGFELNLQDVHCLGNASAGWTMNIDCQTMIGKDVTFSAGSDLRFHVADLTSARLRVKDLGGYWEARIGAGEKSVYLKSGGDVTLVTDQKVEPLPPDYVLGKIEKPAAA